MSYTRSGIVITHKLFPTLVHEFHYDKNEMVKRIVREDCMNYVVDGKAYEISNAFLHQNEKLIEFYFYVSQCIRECIKDYHVDPNNVNVYITKSYFNVMNTGCPVHHHADSDASFVYYCNIPRGKEDEIRFYDDFKKELGSGFTRTFGAVVWDIGNSPSWGFVPVEGQLFIFPGKLMHGVTDNKNWKSDEYEWIRSPQDFMSHRVSIVGDVILTFSESYKQQRTHGNFSPDQWRMFSG